MMKEKTIGILCAMNLECELLRSKLENASCQKAAGLELWSGTLNGVKVVLCVSGIGKVHAALCTQVMIDRAGIDAIINTGIGGGLAQGLKVLDLVVSTKAVQHDFDCSADGTSVRGYVPGFENGSEPTYFAADETLLDAFRKAVAQDHPEQRYMEGIVATGDLFVADPAVKQDLVDTFQASVAEMEGGAVAQAAACNGIPFLIIRAISDLAGDGAYMSYDEFARQAADRSAGILMSMLKILD